MHTGARCCPPSRVLLPSRTLLLHSRALLLPSRIIHFAIHAGIGGAWVTLAELFLKHTAPKRLGESMAVDVAMAVAVFRILDLISFGILAFSSGPLLPGSANPQRRYHPVTSPKDRHHCSGLFKQSGTGRHDVL